MGINMRGMTPMRQRRYGLKVLGLSLLAVVGLMSFSAAAQAHEWLIEKKVLGTGGWGLPEASVGGTVLLSLLLVPGLGLEIHCTDGEFSGTILKGGGSHALILFLGCTVVGATAVCTVHSPGKPNGDIHVEILDELIEHAGVLYDKFVPKTAPNFVKVEILGGECPLTGLSAFVTGSVASKVGPEALFQLVESVNAATRTLLGVGLLYGTEPAVLDGIAHVEITGPAAVKDKAWTAH
jgi:hypothetical protein